MTSCDDTEPLDPPHAWDYGVQVPPYILSDRAMPTYLTSQDLVDVGLGAIPGPVADDVLRFGDDPEERVHLARELRRIALDTLLWDMYDQDVRLWQDCADMFKSRLVELGSFENCSEWIADTVERVLREKEKVRRAPMLIAYTLVCMKRRLTCAFQSDTTEPTTPAHPEYATYHLVQRFLTVLDGTVWLETACDEDTEPSQQKAIGDRRYRNSLARQVVNRVVTLQRALIESCRAAGDVAPPEYKDYEDAEELVKDHWLDIEAAEVWV